MHFTVCKFYINNFLKRRKINLPPLWTQGPLKGTRHYNQGMTSGSKLCIQIKTVCRTFLRYQGFFYMPTKCASINIWWINIWTIIREGYFSLAKNHYSFFFFFAHYFIAQQWLFHAFPFILLRNIQISEIWDHSSGF